MQLARTRVADCLPRLYLLAPDFKHSTKILTKMNSNVEMVLFYVSYFEVFCLLRCPTLLDISVVNLVYKYKKRGRIYM